MIPISIGDLALSMARNAKSTELKTRIATLSDELSSGRTGDVAGRVGAEFAILSDLERSLTLTDHFTVAANEADISLNAAQKNMSLLRGLTEEFSDLLSSTLLSPTDASRARTGDQALGFLKSATQAFNGTVAGRHLFSGPATDSRALNPVADLLSSLRTEVAGLSAASDIVLAVDNWFDAPTGFSTQHYNGSTAAAANARVSASVSVAGPPTANDPTMRAVLKSFALSALASDTSLNLHEDTQTELLKSARVSAIQSTGHLIEIQADIGVSQARIEMAQVQNAAVRTSSEMARNNLLNADPYETAARLQETQFQLESLFSVTARSARLTLLNYL